MRQPRLRDLGVARRQRPRTARPARGRAGPADPPRPIPTSRCRSSTSPTAATLAARRATCGTSSRALTASGSDSRRESTSASGTRGVIVTRRAGGPFAEAAGDRADQRRARFRCQPVDLGVRRQEVGGKVRGAGDAQGLAGRDGAAVDGAQPGDVVRRGEDDAPGPPAGVRPRAALASEEHAGAADAGRGVRRDLEGRASSVGEGEVDVVGALPAVDVVGACPGTGGPLGQELPPPSRRV